MGGASSISGNLDGSLRDGPYLGMRPRLRASEARSDKITAALLLFWMAGTLCYDKTFAYFRIGPVYITEITLGVLILNNLKRFKPSDILLCVVVAAYIIIGAAKYGSFMMAYKDMVWLPYLLFLRFFPRNFPDEFFKILVFVAFAKFVWFLILPIIPRQTPSKYCEGITLIFCLLYRITSKDGKIEWWFIVVCMVAAFCIQFKTLIVVLLLTPIALKSKFAWEKFVAPVPMMFVIGLFVAAVYFNITRGGLLMSVDLLNAMSAMLKLDIYFDSGTAVWRADIWTNAISNVIRDGQLLFGQFPGFNFMDDGYLGMKLNLGGGQGLGVVRTGHCIVVQMIMKGGLFGACFFIWYFFKNMESRDRVALFFFVAVFMMAMTADVLEVPSRGPLFYCYMILLIRMRNDRKRALEEVEQGHPEEHPAAPPSFRERVPRPQ